MNIIKKISSYDYVSFDVFDTLIVRNVAQPTDVFECVNRRFKKTGIIIEDFVKKRIDAERTAVKYKKSEEICLSEIYHYMNIDESHKQIAMEYEIEAEADVCIANGEFKDVLYYCKTESKKVIITSDMYLPTKVMAEILKRNGIHYDYLFVSSEIGLRKSTGHIYDYIIGELNISKSSLIHIGDNTLSDYFIPILKGIKAVRYTRKRKLKPQVSLESSMYTALCNNKNFADNDYYRIGYWYLGILLLGFCQWVKNESNGRNILFFARDGFIMKKAIEILFPKIFAEYVCLSRRSITVPLLAYAKDIEDVVNYVGYVKREETWETFFTKIGIDGDHNLLQYCKDKYGEGFKRKDVLNAPKYSDLYKELYGSIAAKSKNELKESHKYLDPYFKKGKVSIVDIGWYGTMQKALKTYYQGQNVDIKGLYLGLLRRDGYSHSNKTGYIYDYDRDETFDHNLVFGFNGLIESIFSADHGSTKQYQDGKPMFEEWESINWPIISEIHKGALDFCTDISEYVEKYDLLINPQLAYESFHRLLTNPSSKEIKLLGSIVFYDSYYEPLVKTHKLSYYLGHPKTIYSDMMSSNWKLAFLKKVFKLKNPIWFYRFLNRIK